MKKKNRQILLVSLVLILTLIGGVIYEYNALKQDARRETATEPYIPSPVRPKPVPEETERFFRADGAEILYSCPL